MILLHHSCNQNRFPFQMFCMCTLQPEVDLHLYNKQIVQGRSLPGIEVRRDTPHLQGFFSSQIY